MHHSLIRLAVLGAVSVISTQVFAAPPNGFKDLPTTGFAVAGSTNQPAGTSAYTTCNTSGNFGSGISSNPTTTNTTECSIANRSPINEALPPITAIGYANAPVAGAVRQLNVNNTYTGGATVNIGTVLDIVWRKPAATAPVTATDECIYGTKVSLNLTDYNSLAAGNQYFEVNDIARGGFGTRPVAVAYAPTQGTGGEVVFRAGRTYTSVQHRDTPLWTAGSNFGYVGLPLTTPAFGRSINGLDTWPTSVSSPIPSLQAANIHINWVDITTDVSARDDDGSTNAVSHMTYIHSTCSSAAPVAVAHAIRVRQSFQVRSTDGTNPPADQRFIEVSTAGFVPPGGVAVPPPFVPY